MIPERRTEVFQENTLDKIKSRLEILDSAGKSKFFSIQVDGQTVVSKTDNFNEIEDVKRHLFHNTDSVRFTYYRPGGEIDEEITYKLQRQQQQQNQNQVLTGVDIDERIRTAVETERRKWEFNQLQRELSDTKKKLAEADALIEEYEAIIEDNKKNRGKLGGVHLGEVASVMVESFMRRNIDKVKKLPGGSALAGLLSDNPANTQEQQQPQAQTEANFEPIEENNWWEDVEAAFTEDEVEQIKAIVGHLVQQKEKIKRVLEVVIQK